VFQVRAENVALQQQVGVFPIPDNQYQSCCLQLFDVMRKRGCGHGLALADIRAGNAFLLGANLFQNLMAARVGQGLRNQLYLPV
jgi:hypothetical protein